MRTLEWVRIGSFSALPFLIRQHLTMRNGPKSPGLQFLSQFTVQEWSNRFNVFAIRDHSSTVFHTGVSAELSLEIRSQHLFALSTVTDADSDAIVGFDYVWKKGLLFTGEGFSRDLLTNGRIRLNSVKNQEDGKTAQEKCQFQGNHCYCGLLGS